MDQMRNGRVDRHLKARCNASIFFYNNEADVVVSLVSGKCAVDSVERSLQNAKDYAQVEACGACCLQLFEAKRGACNR